MTENSLETKDDGCTLLGGSFAASVQALLALTALATLIYKRRIEPPPRRPWLVWSFDVSKQAFASFLQHLVNLAFGIIFASEGDASECSWYIVSFTVTVACGLLILHVAMAGYGRCVDRFDLRLLRSGEYGEPPSWKPWLAQLIIWGAMATVEKGITALCVIWPLHSYLDRIAVVLEQPFLGAPKVELLLAMVVGPTLLNVLFYWLLDSLVMRRGRNEADRTSTPGVVGDYKKHSGTGLSQPAESTAEVSEEDELPRSPCAGDGLLV